MNDELKEEVFKDVCVDALTITFKIIDEIDFTTDEQGAKLRKIAFQLILEKALNHFLKHSE